MTSSEMVDAKEPGLDEEESLNNDINLNGKPKPPPQPQNPTPTAESHDTAKPIHHVEPQSQQEDKDLQMSDPNTPETPLNVALTSPTKSTTHTNIQPNSNANGTHDDPQDMKFKSEDNDDKASHETNIDAHAKQLSPSKNDSSGIHPLNDKSPQTETKPQDAEKGEESKHEITNMDLSPSTENKKQVPKPKLDAGQEVDMKTPNNSFLFVPSSADGYESGTEEEQAAFVKEVETFYRDNNLEFKAPKFYKEELNLLK